MNYLSLIDSLGKVYDIAKSVTDKADGFNKRSGTSLPQFTKPSLIESPNFLEMSLAEEPVVNDIIKNLYNIYIGYIMIALQMDNLVVGDRRVRDALGVVSTAGVLESFVDSEALVKGLVGATETTDAYERTNDSFDRLRHAADRTPTNQGAEKDLKVPIASGRTIEVSFSTGPNSPPIVMNIMVKFNTRLLPEPIIEYILARDYNSSITNRWLQFRSGEIRFVKDFIFGVDKLQRRAEILKTDTEGALADVFRQKSRSSFKRMAKIAGNSNSQNLANSILMIDAATADRCQKQNGFKFDNLRDRRVFFENTYNLFIVLVDTRFSRVTIYTNGIDQSASYSFNELKASASSDKMSLKEIMEYLGKGQNPRL